MRNPRIQKSTKQKIQDEGLEDRVKLIKEDYRKLSGKFDKIISIEMIEAVGYQFVPVYFQKVSSLLNDDGLFNPPPTVVKDTSINCFSNLLINFFTIVSP